MTTLDYTPARVHIVDDDTKTCPKFRDVISKTYLASTVPECILSRSESRKQASISIVSQMNPAQSVTQSAFNSSNTGVTALQNLTSLTINVSGIYTIAWQVWINVATGTANNMQLTVGGTAVEQGIYRTGVGVNPQLTWTGFITAGTVVTAQAIAADATGTIGVQLTASSVNAGVNAANVVLCDNESDANEAVRWTQVSTIAGAILQPGQGVRVKHNDEVWLVVLGSGQAPLVSVIAEFER